MGETDPDFLPTRVKEESAPRTHTIHIYAHPHILGLQGVYVAARRRSLAAALSFLSLPPPPHSVSFGQLVYQQSFSRRNSHNMAGEWTAPGRSTSGKGSSLPYGHHPVWREHLCASYLVSAIFSCMGDHTEAFVEERHKGCWDVCITRGLFRVALFPEYLHT